jgi:hypothetical protein
VESDVATLKTSTDSLTTRVGTVEAKATTNANDITLIKAHDLIQDQKETTNSNTIQTATSRITALEAKINGQGQTFKVTYGQGQATHNAPDALATITGQAIGDIAELTHIKQSGDVTIETYK